MKNENIIALLDKEIAEYEIAEYDDEKPFIAELRRIRNLFDYRLVSTVFEL